MINIIKAELNGIYTDSYLKEISEIISFYNAYENELKTGTDDEELDYVKSIQKVNYIKKLIDEESRFMFRIPPDFLIEGENVDGLQEYINNVLNINLFNDKLLKASRDALIGKRIAIKLNITKKGNEDNINISFYNSLEFIHEENEEDSNELKKIIFFNNIKDSSDKSLQRYWRQKYEMVEGVCILNEGIYDGYGNLIEEIYTDVNTNLNFIPAYVVFNGGLLGEFGESDVEPLLTIQKNYNDIISKDLDALKFGMNEIVYGIDVDNEAIQEFKNAPGAFWDVVTEITAKEGQAKLGLLSKNFNYSERAEYIIKRMKTEMHELLSIPETDLNTLKGSMTSGKAMKALYWGLINRCEEKWTSWKSALVWLVYAIIEISKTYNLLNDNTEYKVSVNNNLSLIDDKNEEINQDLQQVNYEVMSRLSFYKKWRNNSDEEAMEELKQIALEKRILEDAYNMDFNNLEEA